MVFLFALKGYDVDWEEKLSSVTCEFQLTNSEQEEQARKVNFAFRWNIYIIFVVKFISYVN
jgi:hypothetical protein